MTKNFLPKLLFLGWSALGWASSYADVKSTSGSLRFDVHNNGQADLILNKSSLGIAGQPSANLHVHGNTLIRQDLYVGGATGSANLNFHGALGFGFDTLSSNTDLGERSIILVDTTSDNIQLNLPYAGNVDGRVYTIKKM